MDLVRLGDELLADLLLSKTYEVMSSLLQWSVSGTFLMAHCEKRKGRIKQAQQEKQRRFLQVHCEEVSRVSYGWMSIQLGTNGGWRMLGFTSMLRFMSRCSHFSEMMLVRVMCTEKRLI